MTPPAFAQAILAAAAPADDYEIIAGDLHEEYLRMLHSRGTDAANRWYWAQALLSIAPLLSYSRANKSALRYIFVALISLAVLFAMLVVFVEIQNAAQTLEGGVDRLPYCVWFCINCAEAVIFGAILAWLVRSDGPRVAFCAALFLALCFIIPALAGHPGSSAPFAAWIQLLAIIPAMCIGAGLYQVVHRRKNTVN